jgi:hypothetical protein
MGAEGLGEAVIDEHTAAAADPIENPVDRLAMEALAIIPLRRVGIFVEAERHEIARYDKAARCRSCRSAGDRLVCYHSAQ